MLLAPYPRLAAAQQARNLLMDPGNRIGSAHQMLADMGADRFAERAARELRAAGEHVRKRATRAEHQPSAKQ